jgi:hypothetical protein
MGLLVEPTNSACVVELDLPPGKRYWYVVLFGEAEVKYRGEMSMIIV